MGALPQARLQSPSLRKPPSTEVLDKYGRDPNSLPERLRARGEAWAPRPIAAEADLHRLSSGAVYYAFISIVNTLSLGRPRAAGERWHEWTEPVSAAELAEYTRANVRDIQRKMVELESRGMIAVKTVRVGGVPKYLISLLYSKWREIEDYEEWKRAQKVVVMEVPEDDLTDDEPPAAIHSEALVVSKPKRVAPGAASKAVKISAGVSEFVFQNNSGSPALCSAVLQFGRLVVSAAFEQAKEKGTSRDTGVASYPTNEGRSKGETSRQSSDNRKSQSKSTLVVTHPRAAELSAIFDPVLAKSGATLLSLDPSSLHSACVAIQDCEHEYLEKFVKNRAANPIKKPSHCQVICSEALASWKASKVLDGAGLKLPTRADIEAMCKRDAESLKQAQAEVNRRYKKS